MTVLGIVAEYNPFHNGHRYLIEEARRVHPGAGVVCVMSGHFLQRGEPALLNKWARAEMAVYGGADLVIEMPFCYAVRSAYYFASGALTLLACTGVVTHLLFGSESGDLNSLQRIARVLAQEPEGYRFMLKSRLKQGYSYAVARSQALQDCLNDEDRLAELLRQPNNILALEYLRVIGEKGLALVPVTVRRRGSFHSSHLEPFASATAIRQALAEGVDPQDLGEVMPDSSLSILERELARGAAPVFEQHLEQLVFYNLRTMSHSDLARIYEISEGLENRIKEAAQSTCTLADLRQAIKSKRYSMTRINRSLLYALMGISQNRMKQYDLHGPQYLHVLAFSPRGQQLLQEMQKNSVLPVLNRGSQVKEASDGKLGPLIQSMIVADILATDVFSLLLPHPSQRRGGKDFTVSPLRITT